MINKLYKEMPSISVDYGIMERSNEEVVVPGDFGWNDLGSWDVRVLYTQLMKKVILKEGKM